MKADKFYQQRHEQFAHLAETNLFDLARNHAAEYRMRKAAVEIMLEKHFRKAHDPEISAVLADVLRQANARTEVEAIIESAIEEPLENVPSGPFKAGFTTASMHQEFTPDVQAGFGSALGDLVDEIAENRHEESWKEDEA